MRGRADTSGSKDDAKTDNLAPSVRDDEARRSWAELDAIAQSPDQREWLLAAFERHFAPGVDLPDAFRDLEQSVWPLLTYDSVSYLVLLTGRRPKSSLEELAKTFGASPEATALVAEIAVRYGSALTRSYSFYGWDTSHDWWSYGPRLLKDFARDAYLVDGYLRTRGGDVIRLTLQQDSALRLLRRIIEPLLLIEDKSAFARGDAADLIPKLEALQALLTESSDEARAKLSTEE